MKIGDKVISVRKITIYNKETLEPIIIEPNTFGVIEGIEMNESCVAVKYDTCNVPVFHVKMAHIPNDPFKLVDDAA